MITENEPLVTIGITCYQAADTIGLAISSALQQDWINKQILIVDDCSSDQSVQIIESLISNFKNAQLIRHETNRGPAASRNSILKHASGEYVVFFDDDDVSTKNRIRVQYERLEKYEAINSSVYVACYASGSRTYPNGYELLLDAIGSQPKAPMGVQVANYLLFNHRVRGVFFGSGTPTCALMARKSTFSAVGGFDENLRRVEDVDFAIKLALKSGHFIGCVERLFIQKATVAADKSEIKNFEAELYLVEKHSNYLKQNGRYDYARDWFKIRYLHFTKQRCKFIISIILFILRFPMLAPRHIIQSAPNRYLHERRMKRGS